MTTPTQDLILEVLGARWRTGERSFTFFTQLRPTVRQLEDEGYVGWEEGVVEKTMRVWLTDKGRDAVLMPGYKTPHQREIEDLRTQIAACDRTIARLRDERNRAEMDRDRLSLRTVEAMQNPGTEGGAELVLAWVAPLTLGKAFAVPSKETGDWLVVIETVGKPGAVAADKGDWVVLIADEFYVIKPRKES